MAATSAEVIAARLLGDTTLTGLVSDRIWPSLPPQEPEGDWVCFWMEGSGEGLNLDGPQSARWEEIRFQVTTVVGGKPKSRADAIIGAIRTRLHGWQDESVGVQLCKAQDDANEQTEADGRQVSGQTFMVRFQPI